MTPEEHIRVADFHLNLARVSLAEEHKADGYGSKPRMLRFVENAADALKQAFGK